MGNRNESRLKADAAYCPLLEKARQLQPSLKAGSPGLSARLLSCPS
jgi:hypothetical protein